MSAGKLDGRKTITALLQRFKTVKGKLKREVNVKMCIVRMFFYVFFFSGSQFYAKQMLMTKTLVCGEKVEDNEQKKKTPKHKQISH